LTGATLGIIGLGRIGTAVALRAKAFGMRVVAYDPYIPDGQEKALAVERAYELPDLLRQVDIISFHTPLTDETRHMADEAFFAQLKPDSIVVNTARGPIIKLDALETALRDNRVRAAGLDVVEMEPPDPAHPLIQAWRNREGWIAYRLVITPHAAFVCEEAYHELRLKAAMNVHRALEGAPLRNVVNASLLKHLL
jgi:phosphoglycerate dehydrogenase-like enzyme